VPRRGAGPVPNRRLINFKPAIQATAASTARHGEERSGIGWDHSIAPPRTSNIARLISALSTSAGLAPRDSSRCQHGAAE